MSCCSKCISSVFQPCQAPWISPAKTILLHLGSPSAWWLALLPYCCMLSAAFPGILCLQPFLESFVLILCCPYTWNEPNSCFSPSLSYLLMFLKQIIIKLFIKMFTCNRACDQNLCITFALFFVIILFLSLSPRAHNGSL